MGAFRTRNAAPLRVYAAPQPPRSIKQPPKGGGMVVEDEAQQRMYPGGAWLHMKDIQTSKVNFIFCV